MSFPRARVFADISVVSAGDDVVIFVLETMRYHTFANGAFELWQAADGTRSEDDLALSVFGDRSEFARRRVRVGLEQLAEADLLEDAAGFGVSRRGLAKLGAAAVLAGLPVVTSITAPAAAQGLTPTPAPTIQADHQCTAYSDICEAGTCCCYSPENGIRGWCRPSDLCVGYPCV